jgi:hypothetical protein
MRLFLLLIASGIPVIHAVVPNAVLEQKQTAATVYVYDAGGDQIASGSGFVIGRDGVIATNCSVISKWFESVQSRIFVTTEQGYYFFIKE